MGRAESGWAPRTTRRWDGPCRRKRGRVPCDEDDLMQEENGENPVGTAPEGGDEPRAMRAASCKKRTGRTRRGRPLK